MRRLKPEIMANRLDSTVSALLDANKHPLREEIDKLRTIILSADKSIQEGVKWNAASFRTTEWFATLNGPRRVTKVEVILHAGAKVKGIDVQKDIADPDGLIKWLGKDRGVIYFENTTDIKNKSNAFGQILCAWIKLI